MQSNLRPVRPLLVFGTIVAVFLVAAGSSAGTVPKCGAFKSQAAAQEDFVAVGGGVRHPVGKLDPDHDGVACEGLDGPYAGYATLGYNKRKGFFYGTASLPSSGSGFRYPCLLGNKHLPYAPRRLNVFKVKRGDDKPIFDEAGIGVEVQRASGRLVWRADRKHVVPGRYYAEFEERVRASPDGPTECPSFRSAGVKLP